MEFENCNCEKCKSVKDWGESLLQHCSKSIVEFEFEPDTDLNELLLIYRAALGNSGRTLHDKMNLINALDIENTKLKTEVNTVRKRIGVLSGEVSSRNYRLAEVSKLICKLKKQYPNDIRLNMVLNELDEEVLK